MFETVLIANRGEIACRIARTLKRMNIRSVAVYSDVDRNSLHVTAADIAMPLGGETAADSYLRADLIIAAAKQSGAQAIIPGYGFLSENAAFAEQCEAEGIAFVGPTPSQITQFGLKHVARALAEQAGVPLTPGSGLLPDMAAASAAAAVISYPLMLKSTAGGGGIGLIRCLDDAALCAAFDSVKRQGESFFANGGVFLERFVDNARHIEVQIFGDGKGKVIALGDRDCSLQRRNQKLLEETPAPHLPPAVRQGLIAAATALGRAVNYRSAGTVEFIYDQAQEAFYFLEVNARLQVEHGITECVTGVDLVEWMILTAAGTPPALDHSLTPHGAAIEVRLYAENPLRHFAPSPGRLTEVTFPSDVRVDSWVETGSEISPHYDPMLAKLIVHAENRDAALGKMLAALDATRLAGIATNLDYLRQLVSSDAFRSNTDALTTRFLDDFPYRPSAIEVIDAGTYTSIQDYPGRVGYWDIGVPPSGPMDDWAFRLGNRIVGNRDDAAGIEATVLGPTLRFHSDTLIALTGAASDAQLDGRALTFWAPIAVKAGQVLRVGKVRSGCRVYLSVRHGLDVPRYLGSRSTFALAQLGGHAGRTLRTADVLTIDRSSADDQDAVAQSPLPAPVALPNALIPVYGNTWHIGVLHGPHGAPDFFTPASIDAFFASEWQVHYNSNRLGIRLNGPKPEWARADGGEAGLHPSNIHDCEYAIGSINFTGDMPVILTRDGPSLGGFVCPVTIAKAELWKVGQVRPGDRIRFHAISFDAALALEKAQDRFIATWDADALAALAACQIDHRADDKEKGDDSQAGAAILLESAPTALRPKTVFRQAGDRYILIEFGDNIIDLNVRFRIHALMEALQKHPIVGVLELSPGVRSLQVHYDSRIVTQADLVTALNATDMAITGVEDMQIESRIVHLPMAFEDSATLDAVARYQQTVTDKAPWLPSNTEFIRRINGLASRDDVRDTLYAASYMVLGLGDVYLGAPCAVPLDPRHRLVTSKYNPARTHTAEGSVGIGGIYMCIYGMNSPGGYQLVGRTLPIWNQFQKNHAFIDGKPWLLRFFDQIRFYPVSEAELTLLRDDFRHGRNTLRIETSVFDLRHYNAFLQSIEAETAEVRVRQQHAFDAERSELQRDVLEIQSDSLADEDLTASEEPGASVVTTDITGNVWKVMAGSGNSVRAGDTLLVIEAMKMEIRITAPHDGIVGNFRCKPGMMVNAGDPLVSVARFAQAA